MTMRIWPQFASAVNAPRTFPARSDFNAIADLIISLVFGLDLLPGFCSGDVFNRPMQMSFEWIHGLIFLNGMNAIAFWTFAHGLNSASAIAARIACSK